MPDTVPIKTLDQLIAALQLLRERNGADCPVMLKTYGRELLHVNCSLAATGKSNPHRLVSRGGNPCALIFE